MHPLLRSQPSPPPNTGGRWGCAASLAPRRQPSEADCREQDKGRFRAGAALFSLFFSSLFAQHTHNPPPNPWSRRPQIDWDKLGFGLQDVAQVRGERRAVVCDANRRRRRRAAAMQRCKRRKAAAKKRRSTHTALAHRRRACTQGGGARLNPPPPPRNTAATPNTCLAPQPKKTQTMYVAEWKDGAWAPGALKPYGPLQLMPSAQVLNYGQSVFEGMKAQRSAKDRIVLFRPDRNAARCAAGAARLSMPEFPEEAFVKAVEETVRANAVSSEGCAAAALLRRFRGGACAAQRRGCCCCSCRRIARGACLLLCTKRTPTPLPNNRTRRAAPRHQQPTFNNHQQPQPPTAKNRTMCRRWARARSTCAPC